MPLSTAAKNLALDALAASITHMSLHAGSPGTTGANEVTGGSPAYGRKAVAFNAASGGSLDDLTNGAVFDVPAGTTVTHVGFWSASTGGTYLGSDDLDDPEVFAGQGTFTVSDADITIADA